VNSLPKTVTRQRKRCNLNPGPSVPESSTLTTWLPSHPKMVLLSKESVLEIVFNQNAWNASSGYRQSVQEKRNNGIPDSF